VLLLVPSSLGSITPAVTLHTPYKPAKIILTNPATMSGCGTATLVSPAAFNKTNGIASFSDNANTTWCSSHANNSASSVGSVGVNFGIHVKTTGTHTVQVTWLTVATGFVNLSAGTCTGSSSNPYSGCTRSAQVFVYGTAFILDKNTNKRILLTNKWPGNATYISNYTSCHFTSCTSKVMGGSSGSLHTGAAYWFWNFTGVSLNATHNYSLKMTIFGGARANLVVTGGATLSAATADAQLNSATLGNKEYLYSISIT
jgi:hypothetical protein